MVVVVYQFVSKFVDDIISIIRKGVSIKVRDINDLNEKQKKEPMFSTSTKILGFILLCFFAFLICAGIFNR